MRESNSMQRLTLRHPLVAAVLILALSSQAVRAQTPAAPAAESPAEKTQAKTQDKQPKGKKDKDGWRQLLPGKKLGAWQVTDYGGQGDVAWDGKQLVLEAGNPMTGINYTKKDFPTENYEIRFKAQRVEGSDFFCCLTFPVGDEFCSFVAGGWGGGTTGLSSVNGSDASENETSQYQTFESGKWYAIRLVVDDKKVSVWIDDEQCVDLEREYAKFSTRIEVFIAEPLGLCSFMTKAAFEDIKWRTLEDAKQAEQRQAKEKSKPQRQKTPSQRTAPPASGINAA